MLKTAKIIGLNSDTDAAQSLVLGDESLSLFIVTRVQGEDAFATTRQALSLSSEGFFASSESVPNRIHQLLKTLKESLSGLERVEIIVAAVVLNQTQRRVFYLISESTLLHAWLVRGDKVENLVELGSEKLISGFLESGDKVLIFTGSLLDLVSADRLVKVSVQDFNDLLAEVLPEGQINPVGGILIEDETLSLEGEGVVSQGSLIPPTFKLPLPTSWLSKKRALGVLIITIFLVGVLFGGRWVWSRFFKQNPNQAQSSSNNTISPVLNSPKTANLELWLDLNLVKPGMSVNKLSYYKNRIIILDSQKGSLVSINSETKSHQILAGSEKLGQAIFATNYGDVVWVYSKDKGIVKVDGPQELVTQIVKQDPSWGDIAGIADFAGNIYLLDKTKNQVFKHQPITNGFTEARDYLNDDTQRDLSSGEKMLIDGSVWVLTSTGELLKFTHGERDHYSLSGIPSNIRNLKSFYVSDEVDNIYLLDESRVIISGKSGVFKDEYDSDGLREAQDLVVDEVNKKVFILKAGKIYTLELK